MLHYKNRKRKIHIVTLDPVLEADIYERLYYYPGLKSAELVRPGRNGSKITVEDIHALALDTRSSSVIIMDVRHQTLPRLMQAYGKIVRFNRPDFSTYCYSVVIGDGPRGISHPSGALGAFQKYLADIRIDYSPGVFFADPFLHYSHEEMQELVLYEGNAFPKKLPEQMGRLFKGSEVTVEKARSYFRAAGVVEDKKRAEKKRRQHKLARFYFRMLEADFSGNAQQLKRCMSKKGCNLSGEALGLNIYPFFFEQWVRDLLHKAVDKKHSKLSSDAQPDPQAQEAL